MSRIGKKPIDIPQGVEVKLSGNNFVSVKGPKGQLEKQFSELMNIEINEKQITVLSKGNTKKDKELHGLCRTLISNMLVGVKDGFTKTLDVVGIGYKASVGNKVLNLNLGYSHEIQLPFSDTIEIKVEKLKNKNITNYQTSIMVHGANKEEVGQICATIRDFRPPEVYSGKGIRYSYEQIKLKQGKATGA